MSVIIETPRLILRDWKQEDELPFALLNEDPQVMEFMPKLLTHEESHAFISRIKEHIKKYGYGLFACELKETGEFIGYVGLNVPAFEANFTPCVEIGWRIAYTFWGNGYATEAAHAVLDKAFSEWGLREIVSFTVPDNVRSRRVMEKLGMHHNSQENFQHPKLPEGHPLRLHVLYRIRG